MGGKRSHSSQPASPFLGQHQGFFHLILEQTHDFLSSSTTNKVSIMAGKFEPKVPVNLNPPKDDPISPEELAKATGTRARILPFAMNE